jgi:hypothetical protein
VTEAFVKVALVEIIFVKIELAADKIAAVKLPTAEFPETFKLDKVASPVKLPVDATYPLN